MSGSEAEERIRAKAEAALREAWPSARIIHELVLRQGGCRIDLAAVTPERLIAVEVKSERDVLDRLERQLEAASRVADCVVAVIADKHLAKAREMIRYRHPICGEDDLKLTLDRYAWRVHASTCNSPARLEMLWADELRSLSGHRGPRHPCILAASDGLTGAEVRKRVCAALRARAFPRADPAIPAPIFGLAA